MKRGAPILLVIGGVLALVLCLSLMDVIPPVDMTHTAMIETFVRINLNAQTNKALPLSLQALPKRDGYANQTTDGWGRPLRYSVSEDGVITLRSFGADGKPDGEGKNADISKSYRSKRPDGSLWVGSEMWIVEAEVK